MAEDVKHFSPPPKNERKKIAVLGGGVGAMTTAFYLTHPENPNAHLNDVTVYQMGWRIGGKGASGRNPKQNYRIEEHGLHIWFGHYDNAFRVMRECYAENGRPPDAPLATWDEAFKPHRFQVNKERLENGEWVNWVSHGPLNDQLPGEGPYLLSIWSFVKELVIWGIEGFEGWSSKTKSPTGDDQLHPAKGIVKWLEWIGGAINTAIVKSLVKFFQAFHWAATFVDILMIPFVWLFGLYVGHRWRRVRRVIDKDLDKRHDFIVLNLMYGTIHGIVKDNVIANGFRSINQYDFREWIAKYVHPDDGLTANSAFVLATYDGCFAYINGDNTFPEDADFPPLANMAAGVAVENAIRLFVGFKGAAIWKMQAGMGDVVFGPIYEVLKQRGVRFEFFNRVTDIRATADGESISEIDIDVQAQLLDMNGEYDPLIDVNGLPCWPSEPRWDQLADGKALEEKGVNFEAWCNDESPYRKTTLQCGQDFDEVVLGISIGGLPYVATDLIGKCDQWRDMVKHIQTCRTQGAQIWLSETSSQMGWTMMGQPVVTGYDRRPLSPFDTWADMSYLIPRESWPAKNYPLSLSYLVGCMKDDPPLDVGEDGPTQPCAAMDQTENNLLTHATASEFMRTGMEGIFPEAMVYEGHRPEFNWGLLVDGNESEKGSGDPGPDRMSTQYFRANVQPTERYVLSVQNTDQYRLPPKGSGKFTNMVLSGDWTDNGWNVGCVESAATGGALAANAMGGFPKIDEVFQIVEGKG